PAPWRPPDRCRGDRADPGLRGGDEPGDHRGRADAHGVPASDPVGDDEGGRARRVWKGVEHVRSAGKPRAVLPLTAAGMPPLPGRPSARVRAGFTTSWAVVRKTGRRQTTVPYLAFASVSRALH